MLFKGVLFISEKFWISFVIYVVFPDCEGLLRSMKNGKLNGMEHFLIWKKIKKKYAEFNINSSKGRF